MRPNEVWAERRAWSDSIEVVFGTRDDDGGMRTVAKPIEFVPVEPHGFVSEPTLSLRTEDAQRLMDELWRCGLRPTEGTGSAGALAAVERHLEDMRRLVFKTRAPSIDRQKRTR